MMKLFRKHIHRLKAAKYLRKIAPAKAFEWAVNAPPERKIV